jgi:sRNA-binding protein
MKASYHKNAAALALLAERWPKCFSVYQQRRRPLKIGIRDDIMLELAGTMTPGESQQRPQVLCGQSALSACPARGRRPC